MTDEAADVYAKAGEEAVGVRVVGGGVVVAVAAARVAEAAPFVDADVGLWDGRNRLMGVAHSIYLSDLAATRVEGALLTENRWMKRVLVFFLVSVRSVALLVGEMSSQTGLVSGLLHPPYPSRRNVDRP